MYQASKIGTNMYLLHKKILWYEESSKSLECGQEKEKQDMLEGHIVYLVCVNIAWNYDWIDFESQYGAYPCTFYYVLWFIGHFLWSLFGKTGYQILIDQIYNDSHFSNQPYK